MMWNIIPTLSPYKQVKLKREKEKQEAYEKMKPVLVLENDMHVWESTTIYKHLMANNIKHEVFWTESSRRDELSLDTIKEKLINPLVNGTHDEIYVESTFQSIATYLFPKNKEEEEYYEYGQLANFVNIFLKYIIPQRQEPIKLHVIQKVIGGVDDPMEFIDVLLNDGGTKYFKEELESFLIIQKLV